MIQISYDLKIDKEGENICLYQMDNEGCLHKIVITPSMTSSLIESINEMSSIMVMELPSERESFAKEKEFPSFDDLEEVNPQEHLDSLSVTLTPELIKAGLTGGVGINKLQQEVLGIEDFSSGWQKRLIGKTIAVHDYNKFLALKGATSK